MMPTSRWHHDFISTMLEKALQQKHLVLVCNDASSARKLRAAIYRQRYGPAVSLLVQVKENKVILTLPETPQVYIEEKGHA